MKALQAANYIKHLAEVQGDDELKNSPVKLQKLLFYSQSYALVFLGKPLFSETIEHWVHGPVVRAVWEKTDREAFLKKPPEASDYEKLSTNEKTIIEDVFKVYGRFSTWALRDMSHREKPWLATGANEVINTELMREHFEKKRDLFVEELETIEDLEALRAAKHEDSISYNDFSASL